MLVFLLRFLFAGLTVLKSDVERKMALNGDIWDNLRLYQEDGQLLRHGLLGRMCIATNKVFGLSLDYAFLKNIRILLKRSCCRAASFF